MHAGSCTHSAGAGPGAGSQTPVFPGYQKSTCNILQCMVIVFVKVGENVVPFLKESTKIYIKKCLSCFCNNNISVSSDMCHGTNLNDSAFPGAEKEGMHQVLVQIWALNHHMM